MASRMWVEDPPLLSLAAPAPSTSKKPEENSGGFGQFGVRGFGRTAQSDTFRKSLDHVLNAERKASGRSDIKPERDFTNNEKEALLDNIDFFRKMGKAEKRDKVVFQKIQSADDRRGPLFIELEAEDTTKIDVQSDCKTKFSLVEILKFAFEGKADETVASRKAFNSILTKLSEIGSLGPGFVLKSLMKLIDLRRLGSFPLTVEISRYVFPPMITERKAKERLRPVFIDGPSVQLTVNSSYRLFKQNFSNTPYNPAQNLQMKPIVDCLLYFLLRGHKALAFIPRYYEHPVTSGGFAKVDNINAYNILIQYGILEVAKDDWKDKLWFHVLTKKSTDYGAVLIASYQYVKSADLVKYTFQKPSEKMLVPFFIRHGSADNLMVLQPEINHKTSTKSYSRIPENMILRYPNVDSENEQLELGNQIYIQDQVNHVCLLASLYPLNYARKWAVKMFLRMVHLNGEGLLCETISQQAAYNNVLSMIKESG